MTDKKERYGISRREFIARTGVAAVGTVLAGSLPGYAGEKAKVCKGAKEEKHPGYLLYKPPDLGVG